jgi:hypothetical protein
MSQNTNHLKFGGSFELNNNNTIALKADSKNRLYEHKGHKNTPENSQKRPTCKNHFGYIQAITQKANRRKGH